MKEFTLVKEKAGAFKKRAVQAWSSAAVVVALALQSSPVFANNTGADPFSKVGDATRTATDSIRNISSIIAIAMLVIIGVFFMFGDAGKRKAMSWLPWVVGGIAVISGAVSIVTWVTSLFG